MCLFLKYLFSSKLERRNADTIATFNARQRKELLIRAQVLLDQCSYNDLSRIFEISSTLSALSSVAIDEKKTIIVQGAKNKFIVNYLGNGQTRANFI
jgi:hypothetical protein